MNLTETSHRYRPARAEVPFLLAADVDGTLLGDEEGERLLRVFTQEFPSSLVLAAITGRTPASVMELVQAQRLPSPDFICGCVGTELIDCRDPANTLGKKYAAQVTADWDIEKIYALGIGEGIARQQFETGQPRFQAGFDWDGRAETLAAFCNRLANQVGCRILPSSERYIDVFPPHVGKGEAVRFLQRELAMDPECVVVAGDTGNDREMFDTDFRGILPANSLDELKVTACKPWHYLSPFPAARGVLDGLCHIGMIRDII